MARISPAVSKRLGALAKKNRISKSSLTQVYRRGLGAAVSSGTRKGMTPSSWASARVNSFIKIVKGQKAIKHDPVLVRKERKRRRKKWEEEDQRKNLIEESQKIKLKKQFLKNTLQEQKELQDLKEPEI